jgi:3-hydroxyacyl-CoA dehydrogenase
MAQVHLDREGRIGVIMIDNPPVNATSSGVREGLLAAVREVDADPALSAAVLIGMGGTFVAGADIREFGRPLADPQMPEVIAAIVESHKPFVAALHGAALGGGFELALACDARIAAPGTVVGLPEVTLGMIPGAGGTQHVPRLVGVAIAIEIVCSGRRIPVEDALKLGLIDRIAAGNLRAAAIDRAIAGGKRRLRDLAVPSELPAKVEAAAQAAIEAGHARPQVLAAIEAVKSAAALPYAQALAREREVFQQLRSGPEAAALRHLFFAEREAAKSESNNDKLIGDLMLAKAGTDVADPSGWSAMAAEGARLVAEGIARNAAHVDLVMVRDRGFPRHEGGPMYWENK